MPNRRTQGNNNRFAQSSNDFLLANHPMNWVGLSRNG